jgi:hypothetical protein
VFNYSVDVKSVLEVLSFLECDTCCWLGSA